MSVFLCFDIFSLALGRFSLGDMNLIPAID